LDTEDGAFAEYAVVLGDVALKTPENVSFEEAAMWDLWWEHGDGVVHDAICKAVSHC
jgi:hypothetical protein